jgi:hypothetical protein
MWILVTGVSECDKNFSVFSELKLAAFAQKISRVKVRMKVGESPSQNFPEQEGW